MQEIGDYLSGVPAERIERLTLLMQLIRDLYPDARESMRFKMPTYEYEVDGRKKGWVAVANQKHYVSLYTCAAQHLELFKQKHPQVKTGKGCINFQDKDKIPLDDLIPVINSAMEFDKSHG